MPGDDLLFEPTEQAVGQGLAGVASDEAHGGFRFSLSERTTFAHDGTAALCIRICAFSVQI